MSFPGIDLVDSLGIPDVSDFDVGLGLNFCGADNDNEEDRLKTELGSRRLYASSSGSAIVDTASAKGKKEDMVVSYDKTTGFKINAGDEEQEQYDQFQETEAKVGFAQTLPGLVFIKDALTYLFIILDIILIVYRSTKTYVVVLQLLRGFEEVVPEKDTQKRMELIKQHAIEQEAKLKKDKTKIPEEDENDKGDTIENITNDDEEKEKPSIKRRIFDVLFCICVDYIGRGFIKFIAMGKVLVKKSLGTLLIPKLVIGVMAILATYLCIVIAFQLMTADVIAELGGFDLVLAPLDLNLEYTNLKLFEASNFLNKVSMGSYLDQMDFEIAGINRIVSGVQADLVSHC